MTAPETRTPLEVLHALLDDAPADKVSDAEFDLARALLNEVDRLGVADRLVAPGEPG